MLVTEPGSTERFVPKTAFIGEVRKGRHIVEISLRISPNIPGMLAAVSELLAKHHVNVLSGFHDPPLWGFFADLTESDCGLDQLKSELSSVGGVVKVQIISSRTGVLVDSLHFPLMWGNHRAVLLRTQTMSVMLNRIKELFGQGSPVAKVLLYQLGEAAGKSLYTETKAEVGDEVKNELVNLMNVYSAAGWGVFEPSKVNFDAGTATVFVLNNFECKFYEGVGSQSMSQFVRGHLAGLFSEVFGKRVTVVERECLASGSHYCEFNIMPL